MPASTQMNLDSELDDIDIGDGGGDELTVAQQLDKEIQKTMTTVQKSGINTDLESIIRVEMCIYDSAGGGREVFLTAAYNYLLSIMPTSVEAERTFSSAALRPMFIEELKRLEEEGVVTKENGHTTLLFAGLPDIYKPMIMTIENSALRSMLIEDIKRSEEEGVVTKENGHTTLLFAGLPDIYKPMIMTIENSALRSMLIEDIKRSEEEGVVTKEIGQTTLLFAGLPDIYKPMIMTIENSGMSITVKPQILDPPM
ncbi:unnamed protein product [Diatraea saccharalis]|uniref:Uncharacterized protein n=1 Tax=Diatraea saccharalis TaxID=40085 RepID=A0A9N9R4Z5_9NEOP|nr:unnamed protein product [Diatraea saccharalis]